MKNIILLVFGICLFMFSCSDNIENIVLTECNKCEKDTNCIIDFANLMNFEWDTMCYYSMGSSLEEINKDLGFELEGFIDVCDRVIFLNKKKVIYQYRFPYRPSNPPEGVIFLTDLNKFRVSKSDAKFEVTKEGKAFYLTKR
ncbi:MAG: hypothetical protein LBL74_00235 [Bacteroidales bacterium]|jgi:hypothetical protein|nr:hypothetical protein [Bacteroidales bacterium]